MNAIFGGASAVSRSMTPFSVPERGGSRMTRSGVSSVYSARKPPTDAAKNSTLSSSAAAAFGFAKATA
jgi:hypothetical protein